MHEVKASNPYQQESPSEEAQLSDGNEQLFRFIVNISPCFTTLLGLY